MNKQDETIEILADLAGAAEEYLGMLKAHLPNEDKANLAVTLFKDSFDLAVEAINESFLKEGLK